MDSVARDVIKAENIVDFTTHEGIAERLAKRFGAGVASSFPGLSTQAGIKLR
jgi:protease-4